MTTALQMKLCCTAQLIQAICLIGVCGLAGNHSKHQLPQLCCVKKITNLHSLPKPPFISGVEV